jgi:hypothetical protein
MITVILVIAVVLGSDASCGASGPCVRDFATGTSPQPTPGRRAPGTPSAWSLRTAGGGCI